MEFSQGKGVILEITMQRLQYNDSNLPIDEDRTGRYESNLSNVDKTKTVKCSSKSHYWGSKFIRFYYASGLSQHLNVNSFIDIQSIHPFLLRQWTIPAPQRKLDTDMHVGWFVWMHPVWGELVWVDSPGIQFHTRPDEKLKTDSSTWDETCRGKAWLHTVHVACYMYYYTTYNKV